MIDLDIAAYRLFRTPAGMTLDVVPDGAGGGKVVGTWAACGQHADSDTEACCLLGWIQPRGRDLVRVNPSGRNPTGSKCPRPPRLTAHEAFLAEERLAAHDRERRHQVAQDRAHIQSLSSEDRIVLACQGEVPDYLLSAAERREIRDHRNCFGDRVTA